jgi:Ca2+-binding EF-hand superfamily protein
LIHFYKRIPKMDIRTKQEFVQWIKRAVSTSDDCYIELYNLLLRCYVAADVDMDGKVDCSEFSGMIEAAAALPKQHGQSWWEEGEDQRADLFKKIDDNGDGAISFDEWLAFVINKYKGLVSSLPVTPEELGKDAFAALCKGGSTAGSDEHKALYFLHWKAFQAADADRDGKVDESEFTTLINVLTETPKKLGLSLPALGDEDRKNMFAAMDENGDGAISFNEWLDFSMKTIVAQIQ